MNLFKRELEKEKKEFDVIEFRNMRRNLRQLKQRGTSNVKRDTERRALMPGKRISKSGKVYWETRKNRSDAKGSKL